MGNNQAAKPSNKLMVDQLVEKDRHIQSPIVEGAFRAVDRGMYYEHVDGETTDPYTDTAWRSGNLHLSAPCIYAKVVESLNLHPGLSFLNLGSGTGYLSTIVGLLIGPNGLNHGIELHGDVVEYAKKKLEEFKVNSSAIYKFDFSEPIFVQGNCLNLNPNTRYDRVYLGAACLTGLEIFMKKLVNPNGGILIMPYGTHLMRYVRHGENQWTSEILIEVIFTLMIGQGDRIDEYGNSNASANTRKMIDMPGVSIKSLKETCRIKINQQLRHKTNIMNPNLLHSDNVNRRRRRRAMASLAMRRVEEQRQADANRMARKAAAVASSLRARPLAPYHNHPRHSLSSSRQCCRGLRGQHPLTAMSTAVASVAAAGDMASQSWRANREQVQRKECRLTPCCPTQQVAFSSGQATVASTSLITNVKLEQSSNGGVVTRSASRHLHGTTITGKSNSNNQSSSSSTRSNNNNNDDNSTIRRTTSQASAIKRANNTDINEQLRQTRRRQPNQNKLMNHGHQDRNNNEDSPNEDANEDSDGQQASINNSTARASNSNATSSGRCSRPTPSSYESSTQQRLTRPLASLESTLFMFGGGSVSGRLMPANRELNRAARPGSSSVQSFSWEEISGLARHGFARLHRPPLRHHWLNDRRRRSLHSLFLNRVLGNEESMDEPQAEEDEESDLRDSSSLDGSMSSSVASSHHRSNGSLRSNLSDLIGDHSGVEENEDEEDDDENDFNEEEEEDDDDEEQSSLGESWDSFLVDANGDNLVTSEEEEEESADEYEDNMIHRALYDSNSQHLAEQNSDDDEVDRRAGINSLEADNDLPAQPSSSSVGKLSSEHNEPVSSRLRSQKLAQLNIQESNEELDDLSGSSSLLNRRRAASQIANQLAVRWCESSTSQMTNWAQAAAAKKKASTSQRASSRLSSSSRQHESCSTVSTTRANPEARGESTNSQLAGSTASRLRRSLSPSSCGRCHCTRHCSRARWLMGGIVGSCSRGNRQELHFCRRHRHHYRQHWRRRSNGQHHHDDADEIRRRSISLARSTASKDSGPKIPLTGSNRDRSRSGSANSCSASDASCSGDDGQAPSGCSGNNNNNIGHRLQNERRHAQEHSCRWHRQRQLQRQQRSRRCLAANNDGPYFCPHDSVARQNGNQHCNKGLHRARRQEADGVLGLSSGRSPQHQQNINELNQIANCSNGSSSSLSRQLMESLIRQTARRPPILEEGAHKIGCQQQEVARHSPSVELYQVSSPDGASSNFRTISSAVMLADITSALSRRASSSQAHSSMHSGRQVVSSKMNSAQLRPTTSTARAMFEARLRNWLVGRDESSSQSGALIDRQAELSEATETSTGGRSTQVRDGTKLECKSSGDCCSSKRKRQTSSSSESSSCATSPSKSTLLKCKANDQDSSEPHYISANTTMRPLDHRPVRSCVLAQQQMNEIDQRPGCSGRKALNVACSSTLLEGESSASSLAQGESRHRAADLRLSAIFEVPSATATANGVDDVDGDEGDGYDDESIVGEQRRRRFRCHRHRCAHRERRHACCKHFHLHEQRTSRRHEQPNQAQQQQECSGQPRLAPPKLRSQSRDFGQQHPVGSSGNRDLRPTRASVSESSQNRLVGRGQDRPNMQSAAANGGQANEAISIPVQEAKSDSDRAKMQKRKRRESECEKFKRHIESYIRQLPLPSILHDYLNYNRSF